MISFEEYASSLELKDVLIFAEHVERNAGGGSVDLESEGTLENTFILQNHENQTTFRFKFTLKSALSEISVDLGVLFVGEHRAAVSQDVQLEFASKVALMVAYPYVRNSLWSSAARLGLPRPLLGLIRPDQVKFVSNTQI